MELDRDRLRAILEADHSYYGSHAPESRIDDRLAPGASDFIASQFSPDMRVLDVGCGSGATLLENAHRFASGLGIDDDPAHVRRAEEALRRGGRDNVEFRLLDFPEDGHELEAEPFDFVFSERGPIGYDSYGIQAALRVLSPNPPMRSGLGVGTRGEGRGTRRSALDSDKWGRWRPLVVVGGADGGPGQRRWGGVSGTACRGRQSRTGPVRLCGSVG